MQDFGTKANDTAGPSGQLSAEEFNNLATELENSVVRSGLALSALSTVQLATSLFIHAVKGQVFQDSGVANAYVATPVSGLSGVLLPSDYSQLNGMLIMFKSSAASSGASTLNIGQTTGTLLGTKSIVQQDGTAIPSGAIPNGAYVQLRYDSSIGAGSWVLLPWCRPATETTAGIVEIASAAESQAWVSGNVLSVLRLASAFQGANQSLGQTGFQRIPGGPIFQWGVGVTDTTGTVHSFPFTFPTSVFQVFGTDAGIATIETISTQTLSTSQFNAKSGTGTPGFAFFAIGM